MKLSIALIISAIIGIISFYGFGFAVLVNLQVGR